MQLQVKQNLQFVCQFIVAGILTTANLHQDNGSLL